MKREHDTAANQHAMGYFLTAQWVVFCVLVAVFT